MLWPLGHEAVSKIIQEAAKEAALAAGIDLDAIPQQQEAVVEEKKEEAVAPKEVTPLVINSNTFVFFIENTLRHRALSDRCRPENQDY